MSTERIASLALHFVPGIGDFLVKQLISYCGSAEEVFKLPKGKLLRIPGIGEASATALKQNPPFAQAEAEFQKAERTNTKIHFFFESDFPKRLKHFDDCPSLVYLKGNVNLNTAKTVGIVGTRKCTEYGKERVEELVSGLAGHLPLIVSGLAYGIDIHAHKQSLQNGLPTLGVMASGMDIIYPAVHKDIAKQMTENGGLITEHCFGTKPDAHNFPARNRIIAALSDALIVVEAAEKGGALITAEIANTYNKDVFAVPGSIGNTYSAGCNKLIKTNKAHLLTSVKDIEYIMNWSANISNSPNQSEQQLDLELFDEQERKIISLLQEKKATMMIDELSRKSSLSPSALASLLLGLEFKNVVKSLPGKMYKLARA